MGLGRAQTGKKMKDKRRMGRPKGTDKTSTELGVLRNTQEKKTETENKTNEGTKE